jgi:hypothetical protein
MAEVQAQLAEWKDHDRSPFPDFTSSEKNALKGAIRLPPRSDAS